ncbi:TIGR03618 family F420-dependent PPOX class oxidoreductase [Nakamurella lactea]|uniref:TIGR03618 family F420-dependent PPOX class oxidoreductase n=1 Tax=Nakamurella lactea TaxID=459515 RepID=UPI000402907B|nr:TIGR03618 family F420-dependent PPOX class oxidoreductase [Nakamurella lactea]
MPTTPIPDDLRAMLSKPNPAVIATLNSSGQPITVATWYLLDGDRILVNMDNTRKRVEHMRNDGRVALTVLDDDWSTHVSVIGHVAEWKDDEALADIDRISTHYTGHRYPNRTDPRVSAWIEIDRWHGWGKAKQG